MRFIKLILIGAVAIFVVVWLMSLFFPSFVRVSRAINIHASKEELRPYLADINKWEKWNEMISDRQFSHKQITERVFTSDQLTVRIQLVHEDSVAVVWTQENGKEIPGGFNLYAGDNPSVTTVHWYFDFRLRWYPWEKIGSIIFDKQLGPVMEKSLDNLRNIAEQKQ